MATQTTFTIGTEADLDAAIQSIDQGGTDAATGTAYTISLSGDIAITAGLPALNLPLGSSLILDGGGNTLDGGGAHRGLLVSAGSVTIDSLTISDMRAVGAAGSGGGGGGAGLGGGVFVGAAGSVTLAGVIFQRDAAGGGLGGPGGAGQVGAASGASAPAAARRRGGRRRRRGRPARPARRQLHRLVPAAPECQAAPAAAAALVAAAVPVAAVASAARAAPAGPA